MEVNRMCVECGAELPATAPQGLCTRCLLGMQVIKQGSPDRPDPAAAGHATRQPQTINLGSGENASAPFHHSVASEAFVVFADHGASLTSTDGIRWSALTSAAPAKVALVARGGGLLVRVRTGPILQTSTDGASRTDQISGTPASLHGVAFGKGMFAALGNEGALVTSADGLTWTSQNSGTDERLRGVAFGSGLFDL